MIALLALPMIFAQKPVATASETEWVAFNPQMIQQEVSRGKIVFVDVTADWCLTCKVNKKVVLESSEILDQFSQDDIITMKADWTNPDPAIADYLASFGRYGIPFNVVYSATFPKGQPFARASH